MKKLLTLLVSLPRPVRVALGLLAVLVLLGLYFLCRGHWPDVFSSLFSHSTGFLSLAVAVPVTITDVPVAEADGLNLQDVNQEITKMNPDRYPLDTIMRHALKKTRRAQSQECKYYEQSAKPMFDGLDASATGSGINAASPCSAYTAPTSVGITSVFVQVSAPKIWRTKDTLLMRDLVLSADAAGKLVLGGSESVSYDQMFYVVAKSGSVLELMPVGGMVGTGDNAATYVVPTFTSATVLYRMGSAMAEKDARTEPFAMLPSGSVNYCQNFMCQIEMSTFEKMTKKEVPVSFSDQEVDMLYNMRGEIESSFIWGDKFIYNDGSGNRTYFTGGITRQIKKVLTYGRGGGNLQLTVAQYVEWLKSLFTGNDGSTERILLAGADLISAIEQLHEGDKLLSPTMVQDTYLGVKCSRLVSSFGVLHIVHAPLLDEQGWGAKGIALDPEHIYKEEFQPMIAKDLDFKSSGEKNADAKMLQGVSCLILRYPDCHAIIEPMA